MADITKCKGIDCPVADDCYRFKAKDGHYQSYFSELNVGEVVDGKFKCNMYWGEKAEQIWNQLKDITDGKD